MGCEVLFSMKRVSNRPDMSIENLQFDVSCSIGVLSKEYCAYFMVQDWSRNMMVKGSMSFFICI